MLYKKYTEAILVWALDWLKIYDKDNLEGLKDRTKSGRPSEISEVTNYQIKKELYQLAYVF